MENENKKLVFCNDCFYHKGALECAKKVIPHVVITPLREHKYNKYLDAHSKNLHNDCKDFEIKESKSGLKEIWNRLWK